MELTHTSRKLLKRMRSLVTSESDILDLIDDQAILYNQSSSQTLDCTDVSGFFGIIRYLVKQGALYYPYEGNPYHIAFTHEGLHPYEVTWEQLKSFLFQSVLVPIGVSLITTLLTLLVRWLLSSP